MSVYLQANTSERRKIRNEMLKQARIIVDRMYQAPVRLRRIAARRIVDQALAKERNEDDVSDAQQSS
jgi:hypothetical protein